MHSNENKLNIEIETGADFALSFYIYDDNGDVVDMTGAIVAAQLREFAESHDYYSFTTAHNGAGGRVKVNMPHELTSQLPYTTAVWDVFITYADGTVTNPIWGDVRISPRATRVYNGTLMNVTAVWSLDLLPATGQSNLLYYVYEDNVFYRWNGTNYISQADANGIANIELISSEEEIKTYRIMLSDGSYYDFAVSDGSKGDTGVGIAMIAKTGSSGLVDTYTVTFTDETTTTFTVTNGEDGEDGDAGRGISSIVKTSSSGLVDTYTVSFTDESTPATFTVTNGIAGITVENEIASFISGEAYLLDKASVITPTVTDSLITLTDAANAPVKSLTVAIEPVQEGSGDPSPDNVRPISGWTGCNVYRTGKNQGKLAETIKTSSQKSTLVYSDDGVTVTATNTYGRSGWSIPVKKGETYTVSFKGVAEKSGTGYNNKVYFGDANAVWNTSDSNYLGNKTISTTKTAYTFTFTAVTSVLFFGVYVSSTATDGAVTISEFQLELGSTATTYESYNGTTLSIDWESEAGTVYRGTWDVTTGVLTVTDAQIASYNGETLPSTWISDRDAYASGTAPTTGAQVVYALATPITYQLTPAEVTTLLGMNAIWADTGNVTVTYRADTKSYIDQQLSARDLAIKSLMTAVESSMTLTANRSSGDVVIVGDTFYKLTTNVASDSTLVVGTNCVVSNMAEWVLSLQL